MKKSHKNYPFRKVNFDGNFLYSLDCTNTLAKETEWGNWTLVVLWCWLLGCHWRSTSGVLALAPAVTWVPGQARQAVTSQHMWGHHVQDMDVELLLFCWTQSRHIVSQLLLYTTWWSISILIRLCYTHVVCDHTFSEYLSNPVPSMSLRRPAHTHWSTYSIHLHPAQKYTQT